jgi:demethylmenaquinone methyltransferase/2-methoxy-6-polyprenyl-1,4-benzoquinol methylase
MVRVTRPGGRVAILEFSRPRHWLFGRLYRAYFRWVLPCVGQTLSRSRDNAYNYLPASVMEFPDGEALADKLRGHGLTDVRWHPLTFGIATLYVGTKKLAMKRGDPVPVPEAGPGADARSPHRRPDMDTKGDFTLDDFRKQLEHLDAVGGDIRHVRSNMAGLPRPGEAEDPKEELRRIRRIIDAMTDEERREPDGIDAGRRLRIAAESGTTPDKVEQFLDEFRQIRELMRRMARMSVWEWLRFRKPPPEAEDDE